VPGCFNALIATVKSLSVVTATAAMFIVPMAAPTMHEPPHCAEQPNVTVQRAVAGTVMRIDSVGSGRVNEKK
jgi:hypothetical protein